MSHHRPTPGTLHETVPGAITALTAEGYCEGCSLVHHRLWTPSEKCLSTTDTTNPCKCFPKAMAPHSSTLAWKIPWREESGRLQSMGSLRVRHDWSDLAAAAAAALKLSYFLLPVCLGTWCRVHIVSSAVCTKPSTWLLGPNLTLVLACSFLLCCLLGSGDTGDTF